MKWLMLKDEVARLAERFASVNGAASPEAKREREPMKIRNGVASITIKGALYPKRVSWMDYWGEDYAVYTEIIADIAEAKFKGASSIDFYIDSPGGRVDGLYDAMTAIRDSGIATRTIAGNVLASAAYMLASQTDQIIVTSPASAVGSFGVATSLYVSDSVVDITNRDSEKKRPDVRTEEGRAVVADELDDFWAIYAEMVAAGRNTTLDTMKKNYGQGAVMTARTALSQGMIDGIMQEDQPATSKAATIGAKSMNLEELKAQYPGVYAAVLALGKEAGSKEERDRVCAHLKLAEGSGDIETAHADIKSGDGITATVTAAHLSASMRRHQQEDRAADNPPELSATPTVPIAGDKEEKAKQEFLADHKGWVVE